MLSLTFIQPGFQLLKLGLGSAQQVFEDDLIAQEVGIAHKQAFQIGGHRVQPFLVPAAFLQFFPIGRHPDMALFRIHIPEFLRLRHFRRLFRRLGTPQSHQESDDPKFFNCHGHKNNIIQGVPS